MKRLLLLAFSLVLGHSAFAVSSETIGSNERPAIIKLPKSYDATQKYPLVLLLHGLGNTKEITDNYLGLSRNQDRLGYILILPQGTVRPSDGKTFWNATPECCDKDNTGVDDSAYLSGLVKEAISKYSVDTDRVYAFGHSNGGYMAHRLACDNEGLFKGIVSVAGPTFGNANLCKTQTPINILQLHGTKDDVVFFDTTGRDVQYPGALGTIDFWGARNGCQVLQEKRRALNLVFIRLEPIVDIESGSFTIGGNELLDYVTLGFDRETDTYTYSSCTNNTRSALWKINGSGHVPVFLFKDFVGKSINFLEGR